MKLLSDFFPVLIFFLVYKFFGIYYATGVFIITSCLQMAFYWLKYRRFEQMHVITFVLGAFLGGITLYLHDELFIKWKPTAIYWSFAVAFITTQFFGKQPLIKSMLENNIKLPAKIWSKLNLSWAIFFSIMGILNLYVVYHFDTNFWVNFKLFGIFGLTVLFIIIQVIYMGKYIIEEPTSDRAKPN